MFKQIRNVGQFMWFVKHWADRETPSCTIGQSNRRHAPLLYEGQGTSPGPEKSDAPHKADQQLQCPGQGMMV